MTDSRSNSPSLPLRAHHGMCFQFFTGNGYSSDFTSNMAKLKVMFERDNPLITVTDSADVVCRQCPNLETDICSSAEKVCRYDYGVLERCGLKPGDTITYSEFIRLVHERVIAADQREAVCGDCSWTELCK